MRPYNSCPTIQAERNLQVWIKCESVVTLSSCNSVIEGLNPKDVILSDFVVKWLWADLIQAVWFMPNYSSHTKFAGLNQMWISSYIVKPQPRHWRFKSRRGTLFHFVDSTRFPLKSTLVSASLLFRKTNTKFVLIIIHTINHAKQSCWI